MVAAGGFLGYVKKGSTMSVVAGALVGAGFAYSGVLLQRGLVVDGLKTGAVMGALLGGAMGARWWRTGKFMPAGASCLLGVALFIYFASEFSKVRGRGSASRDL